MPRIYLRGRGGGRVTDPMASEEQLPNAEGSETRVGRGGKNQAIRGRALSNGLLMSHSSGRQFGGRLTSVAGEVEHPPTNQRSSLQADAPEFRPGQTHQQRPLRSKKANRGSGPPKSSSTIARGHGPGPSESSFTVVRGSIAKSNAPDIATRISEDIANGVYECPICTSEVARKSKVWSCKTCWTVFHLTCIKKWSQNGGSTLAQQQLPDSDLPPARQWRCPGCNLPKDALPSTYSCWCDKEVDPRSIPGLPPHSCGQTCGKVRILPKKCPHPCELLCHAGPCPPCTHIGPVQSCFCGKKSISRRCVDTLYDTGWSCGEVCGDLMPCGEHTCQRSCHGGLCGACLLEVEARCYCGKVAKLIRCSERGEGKQSQKFLTANEDEKSPPSHDVGLDNREQVQVKNSVDAWTGNFDCGASCARAFDCGKHICELHCHAQRIDATRCPRSPDVVSHCPCGKTPLSNISDQPRQSCEDQIPNCRQACLKELPCGHQCQQICHSGACRPCLKTIYVECGCGRTTCSTICHQGICTHEPPQCMRTCKTTLNCGRHECGEHCCPGEKKATERQVSRRKLRSLGSTSRLDDGFEAEHICTRLCGRTLKCGIHPCPELCHKGPCASCREAIFDDISCHCGRTILQPPLPCGTQPPLCRFECELPKICGHPQIPHNCHGDECSCPKCPFLVEKLCLCGKKALKNQPCWLSDVRCGEVCGRKLRCGSHLCRKPCHRPGECEDAGKSCQQLCGKAKKSCGHPCKEICHAPSSCQEDKSCQSKLLITCHCQRLKQEAKCNASKTSEGGSKKALKCDDECARLERNRRLALALDIDSQTHTNTHIPYSTITIQLYLKSTKWAQTQEREFRVFAADEAEKRLRFKPMPSSQRAFIHSLAEDFGFDSESMDPEPHRHILILKTPRFVMAPMKTLMECVRIVRTQANEAASSVINEGQSRHQASYEPFNGYVLTNPRFALTLDELRSDFAEILATVATLTFNISLLPSEEIVLRAHSASSTTTISAASTEALLKSIKPALASVTTTKRLAVSIHLCTLDSSLNLLRQESDGANTDGWSQVAAKGAVGPRFAPKKLALGTKSSFTILGSKVVDAKKKKEDKHKEEESVIEDWEEEFRREEELVLAAEKVEPDSKALSASKHATGEETKASTLSDLKDATDDEPRGKLTASVAALN